MATKEIKYTIQGFRIQTVKVPPFMDGEYIARVQILKEKVLMQGYQASFTVMKFKSG
jgi:hypothetical protein